MNFSITLDNAQFIEIISYFELCKTACVFCVCSKDGCLCDNDLTACVCV